jgi:hypothetical protein
MRGISGMVVQIGPCKVAAIEMVELRRTWGGSVNSTIPAKEQCSFLWPWWRENYEK